jgi:hypothetical protein
VAASERAAEVRDQTAGGRLDRHLYPLADEREEERQGVVERHVPILPCGAVSRSSTGIDIDATATLPLSARIQKDRVAPCAVMRHSDGRRLIDATGKPHRPPTAAKLKTKSARAAGQAAAATPA